MKEEELEEQAEHQACAHIGITSYKRNPDAHSLFKTGFRVGAKFGMKNAIEGHKVTTDKISIVEKENAELKEQIESLTKENDVLIKGLGCETCSISGEYLKLNNTIRELEAQIEKMKCCGNCKHIEFRFFVESMQTKNITNYCSDCIRFIKINKKDKWESAE